MKRKLISYEVFENIQQTSITHAEHELSEASPIVAKALGLNDVKLISVGKESALYEASDGTYVHANYRIDGKTVKLNNIEQLAIDETTEVKKSKEIVGKMFDALLEMKGMEAETYFNDYLKLPNIRRELKEGAFPFAKDKKKDKDEDKDEKNPFFKMKKGKKDKKEDKDKKMKSCDKKLKEWLVLANNVKNYVSYKEYGPALKESVLETDDRGNVVSISLPSTFARNEHKMLAFNWKTLNTDVKVLRSGAKNLSENNEFCKAVAELKRHNALSDNEALEEALENVVSRYPSVLYLTQDELSETIKSALETVSATNYDDQTCDFMAEGILRTAHDAYTDRVSRIVRLAGTNIEESAEDKYEQFKNIVNKFYPTLDESSQLEMQVFVDLYEAFRQVFREADRQGRKEIKIEANGFLRELHPIVSQEVEPSLEVAFDAASWLNNFVETNLETQSWDVSNTPYITNNGDHPQMSKNAAHPYKPSADFSGEWGDPAPVSDGKSYKGGLADEMRGDSWGNIGGNDTYPSMSNPYVPKPFGDYKIKGEKDIDGDSDLLGHAGGSDTWPGLSNPYLLPSETPQSYKMKSDNLVVDN